MRRKSWADSTSGNDVDLQIALEELEPLSAGSSPVKARLEVCLQQECTFPWWEVETPRCVPMLSFGRPDAVYCCFRP